MKSEKKKRVRISPKYQVTQKLMEFDKKRAIFMHCLPAYRGKEVASEVIDGPQLVVFDEAENRLHAQNGLIIFKEVDYLQYSTKKNSKYVTYTLA